MTCRASMMLTAVVRLTDTRFRELCRLPGLVPGATSTSKSLHRSLFTVDVEPGRRYPVFIVWVRN